MNLSFKRFFESLCEKRQQREGGVKKKRDGILEASNIGSLFVLCALSSKIDFWRLIFLGGFVLSQIFL